MNPAKTNKQTNKTARDSRGGRGFGKDGAKGDWESEGLNREDGQDFDGNMSAHKTH